MNTTAFRRAGAIAAAAAVTTAVTVVGTTAPSTAGTSTGTSEPASVRPCFTVRSTWNDAEGPQPTCPSGRFEQATSEQAGAARSAVRIADFMP